MAVCKHHPHPGIRYVGRGNDGVGGYGFLGIALGNTSTVTIPVPVAATAGVASGWAAVSAGERHTCAIAYSSRAAYCWGACIAAGALSLLPCQWKCPLPLSPA